MTLSVVPIGDIEAPDWDVVVRASPDGWVFALHGWQRLVTDVEAWGFEEHGFGLMEDGRLVAVCPLHYKPAARTAGSSGWGGSGPVIAGDLRGAARRRVFAEAVEHCIETSRRLGATRFDVTCSPVTRASLDAPWGVNPFALERLADTSLLSQVIALEPDQETLWMGLSKTARNLVRRTEKAGFKVESVDWRESLDTYYAIHTETYLRTGVSPHPRAYFEGIANRMSPSGASRLLALKSPGGEAVAFHNMALFGAGACYHTGCSRDIAQGDSVGYLLMWEAIKAAKSAGALWFDCGLIFPGATDSKQKGLTLFKTRFGGEPHRAFRSEEVFDYSVAEAEKGSGEAPGHTAPHATRLAILAFARRWLRRARRWS
ncbi:GNAT family N-acetyltransferase [Bradyrhizobium sediminis]|uniref:GNAT family N-acetyltransferase n=1 Tax=Bradyrhizobium sediminis TaxID=2840469 RepID=A0A975P2G9_9BRAD|nr:GNAT family N-acetyltransferase [Bradyrhizobium sediminis]QWG25101.1 GNAT family N-acetyltransferase [Bradyrhizobium sediminis]